MAGGAQRKGEGVEEVTPTLQTKGLWPRVDAKNPCPICGNSDWCTLGQKVVHCMRVESSKPCHAGGWYHPYPGGAAPEPVHLPAPSRPAPTVDAEAIFKTLPNDEARLSNLAVDLGVTLKSLKDLECRWAPAKSAYAFPMKDGAGKRVGLRLRHVNGDKWTWPGTKTGLFIPNLLLDQDMVFLPEGPTDAAALLSIGLLAIGRPSCQSDVRPILATLRRLNFRRAVIVADNDQLKRVGTTEARPGIVGALRLKRELAGVRSVIWIPPSPCKDARSFLQRGGTKEMILNDINQQPWTIH